MRKPQKTALKQPKNADSANAVHPRRAIARASPPATTVGVPRQRAAFIRAVGRGANEASDTSWHPSLVRESRQAQGAEYRVRRHRRRVLRRGQRRQRCGPRMTIHGRIAGFFLTPVPELLPFSVRKEVMLMAKKRRKAKKAKKTKKAKKRKKAKKGKKAKKAKKRKKAKKAKKAKKGKRKAAKRRRKKKTAPPILM
jgi:hypothetical protein